MKEYLIQKPRSLEGYPIHRAIAALVNGAQHIWRDNGDTVSIRTKVLLDAEAVDLPDARLDEVRLFTLRACVSRKIRGRHIYPARGDNKARMDWLERQGRNHGFAVVVAHCVGGVTNVARQAGREFALDSTDFTGALKVTDVEAFKNALRVGVGGTGRAFGFSLLAI